MSTTATVYQRHTPPSADFRPLEAEDAPTQHTASAAPSSERSQPPRASRPTTEASSSEGGLLDELTDGIRSRLSGLFQGFSFQNLDSGDILLLLIIVLLFLEGDDLDLAIALGLTLLLSFGTDAQSSA